MVNWIQMNLAEYCGGQHPKIYLVTFVAEDSRSGSGNVETRVLVPVYNNSLVLCLSCPRQVEGSDQITATLDQPCRVGSRTTTGEREVQTRHRIQNTDNGTVGMRTTTTQRGDNVTIESPKKQRGE